MLVNIILKLEHVAHGGKFLLNRNKHIKKILQSIDLEHIDILHQGVSLDQFHIIEDLPFKIFQKHYTFLKKYKGIALNIYSCQYNDSLRSFSLLPIKLSSKWNKKDFFPIGHSANYDKI